MNYLDIRNARYDYLNNIFYYYSSEGGLEWAFLNVVDIENLIALGLDIKIVNNQDSLKYKLTEKIIDFKIKIDKNKKLKDSIDVFIEAGIPKNIAFNRVEKGIIFINSNLLDNLVETTAKMKETFPEAEFNEFYESACLVSREKSSTLTTENITASYKFLIGSVIDYNYRSSITHERIHEMMVHFVDGICYIGFYNGLTHEGKAINEALTTSLDEQLTKKEPRYFEILYYDMLNCFISQTKMVELACVGNTEEFRNFFASYGDMNGETVIDMMDKDLKKKKRVEKIKKNIIRMFKYTIKKEEWDLAEQEKKELIDNFVYYAGLTYKEVDGVGGMTPITKIDYREDIRDYLYDKNNYFDDKWSRIKKL